jgi:hypothetical protein
LHTHCNGRTTQCTPGGGGVLGEQATLGV